MKKIPTINRFSPRQLIAHSNEMGRQLWQVAQSSSSGGSVYGPEGFLVDGIEPQRVVARIIGTDGGTPPKYSYEIQQENTGNGLWDDEIYAIPFTGSPSLYPAYEYSGNADVPIDGSAVVELRMGEGGEYWWFWYQCCKTFSGPVSFDNAIVTFSNTSEITIDNSLFTIQNNSEVFIHESEVHYEDTIITYLNSPITVLDPVTFAPLLEITTDGYIIIGQDEPIDPARLDPCEAAFYVDCTAGSPSIKWVVKDENGTPFTFTLGAAGTGTVTSVGLALPTAEFTVTNSPVTTTGTLTGAWKTQTANTFFSGPASGAAAVPTFRALTTGDLPTGAGKWIPVVVDFDDFTAAATQETITVYSLPAKGIIHDVVVKHTTAFSGGGAVSAQVNISNQFTGPGDEYFATDFNVFQAVSDTVFDIVGEDDPNGHLPALYNFGATTDIKVKLVSNVNVNTLTAGSVTFWLKVSVLP